jgi:hypothetical protein
VRRGGGGGGGGGRGGGGARGAGRGPATATATTTTTVTDYQHHHAHFQVRCDDHDNRILIALLCDSSSFRYVNYSIVFADVSDVSRDSISLMYLAVLFRISASILHDHSV